MFVENCLFSPTISPHPSSHTETGVFPEYFGGEDGERFKLYYTSWALSRPQPSYHQGPGYFPGPGKPRSTSNPCANSGEQLL